MNNKVAYLSVFLAFAMILSYVESLIPFYFGIPGIKLGLANLIIVIMLYTANAKTAFCISMLRIVLSGFLFGNLFSIIYSLAGGILSFLIMLLVKKMGCFHLMSVSICGGIAHNIGQIIIASIVVETYAVYYYIPVLLIAGIITGALIGIVANEVTKRIGFLIREAFRKDKKDVFLYKR